MKKTNVPLLILIGSLAFILIVVVVLQNTVLFPEMSFRDSNRDNQQGEEIFTTEIGESISIDTPYLSGSYPEIQGTSRIAVDAQEAIESLVTDLKLRAETEIPDLRADFPDTFGEMRYELIVEARLFESADVSSLVLDIYEYTGGANGTLVVRSFNQRGDNSLVMLGELISMEQRPFVLQRVQGELRDYSLPGYGPIELFSESISNLSFGDFDTFAVDAENLLIYFDEYEVGPGFVGSVEIIVEDYQSISERNTQKAVERISLLGTSCFELNTDEDGVNTESIITITLDDNFVIGTKEGTTQSPEYSAGYQGVLSGTLEDDTLNLIYEYTVDGSRGRQEERYRIEDDALIEERYVLVEDFEDNILRIDESAPRGELRYQNIRCE